MIVSRIVPDKAVTILLILYCVFFLLLSLEENLSKQVVSIIGDLNCLWEWIGIKGKKIVSYWTLPKSPSPLERRIPPRKCGLPGGWMICWSRGATRPELVTFCQNRKVPSLISLQCNCF